VVDPRPGSHPGLVNIAIVNSQLLLTFTLTVAVIVIVPGPSVLFIVGRALSAGRPAAVAAAAGNSLGAAVQGVFGAFGVGTVVSQSPAAYAALKTGGALYLVAIGTSTLRHRRLDPAAGESVAVDQRRHLRQGFVVGVMNPKTLVFLVAALPQFVDPARGHVVVQMLVLLAVYSVLCLAGDTSFAFAGGFLRGWTANSPQRIEQVVGFGGICIVGMGLLLALH
jgi:threonine/homoserine/homoserine lactone efflux protein